MRRLALLISPALRRELRYHRSLTKVLRDTNAYLSSELRRLEGRVRAVEAALKEAQR